MVKLKKVTSMKDENDVEDGKSGNGANTTHMLSRLYELWIVEKHSFIPFAYYIYTTCLLPCIIKF